MYCFSSDFLCAAQECCWPRNETCVTDRRWLEPLDIGQRLFQHFDAVGRCQVSHAFSPQKQDEAVADGSGVLLLPRCSAGN